MDAARLPAGPANAGVNGGISFTALRDSAPIPPGTSAGRFFVERARELAQDAVLAAWEQLPSFRGEASFRTWLLRIARYRCFRSMRRQRDLLTEDGFPLPGLPSLYSAIAGAALEPDTLLAQTRQALVDGLDPDGLVW